MNFEQKNPIIKNIEILKTGNAPESSNDLLHRENEINKMEYHFSHVIQNIVPSNMLMFGEIGSGKTAMIKITANELKKEAEKRNINLTIHYINCNSEPTEMGILQQLVAQYNMHHSIKPQKIANSTSQYFHHYIKKINETNGIIIIILDEIDKMKPSNLLYNLSRVKENGFTDFNVCVVGISNNFLFEKERDPRELSSFRPTRITVPPYNTEQLIDILINKAEKALKPNTWDIGTITMCATRLSACKGDARSAIELLKTTAEIAEKTGKTALTENDVLIAEKELQHGTISTLLSNLPPQKTLMLLACMHNMYSNDETTTTKTAYQQYAKLCDAYGHETYTDRSFRTVLNEFEIEGLININKTSRGRARGIQNQISTELSIESTIDILTNALES